MKEEKMIEFVITTNSQKSNKFFIIRFYSIWVFLNLLSEFHISFQFYSCSHFSFLFFYSCSLPISFSLLFNNPIFLALPSLIDLPITFSPFSFFVISLPPYPFHLSSISRPFPLNLFYHPETPFLLSPSSHCYSFGFSDSDTECSTFCQGEVIPRKWQYLLIWHVSLQHDLQKKLDP